FNVHTRPNSGSLRPLETLNLVSISAAQTQFHLPANKLQRIHFGEDGHVLFSVFLSVTSELVLGVFVSTFASPVFVHVSSRANTRRSGALCESVMMQPFIAGLPMPVKVTPPGVDPFGDVLPAPVCAAPPPLPP